MPENKVIIQVDADTKNFDSQIAYLERKLQDLESEYDRMSQFKLFRENSHGAIELRQEIEKTSNQLIRLREAQSKINGNNFNEIKKAIGSVGNSVQGVTKKVVRWGLAVFGIRSAYLAIRQAMSTLSQYDKNMAADIEYIRYVIANALKPVIEGIIQLVYKLLQYINYIAQAWFGINLFAGLSTKEFEKQKKALGGSVKSAKELKKTIAGFDEMNVLQDNTSAGGVGGGGTGLPNTDLSKILGEGKIPGWIDWIAKHGISVAGILGGIATALTLVKLGVGGLMATGIGIVIAGVAMAIEDILDCIKDPSWEKIVEILGDIAIVIGGIMLIMGNWWGLLVVFIGAVVKLVMNNWGAIKDLLSSIGKWIHDHVIEPVKRIFEGLWNDIKEAAQGCWEGLQNIFSPFAKFFKHIFTDAWNAVSNLFKQGGKIFSGLKEGIVQAFKSIVNLLISGINKVIAIPFKTINGLLNTIRSINILGSHPFKGLWKKNPLPVPEIPKLAKGGIINMPGAGVPVGYGSAIAGERGREGVIPLTDSQQMALLGEAIGKYITINATITNTMNGRVISRELQKINNESDFAFNR